MSRKKRGYSREFPAKGGDRYDFDGIPTDLWKGFRAKCRKAGVSVRTRLLQLVKQDLEAQSLTQPKGPSA